MNFRNIHSRIYGGGGSHNHLKNEKIFRPIMTKMPSTKKKEEITPEVKVKQVLDKAFEQTKAKTQKRHFNDIQHTIPPSNARGHSTQIAASAPPLSDTLNPVISSKLSGNSKQLITTSKKIKKKSPKKKEGQIKQQKKKPSIFDNY